MHPTPDQLAAVERWHRRHGRSWKAELRAAWESGAYHTNDDSLLQQLRNEFGPRWLNAYRPGDDQVGYLYPFKAGNDAGWRLTYNVIDAAHGILIPSAFLTKASARKAARLHKITLIEDRK